MTLVRIIAPHFVAGLETDGIVRDAILQYMIGWPDDRVRAYVRKKNWRAHIVRMKNGADQRNKSGVQANQDDQR